MEVRFECSLTFKGVLTAKDKGFINDLFTNIRDIRGSSNLSLVLYKQYIPGFKSKISDSLSLYKKFNIPIIVYKDEPNVNYKIGLPFNVIQSFQGSVVSKLSNYIYYALVKDNKKDYVTLDSVSVNSIRPSGNINYYYTEPFVSKVTNIVNMLKEYKSSNSLSKTSKVDTYQYKNLNLVKLASKNRNIFSETNSVVVKSNIIETKPVDCYKYDEGNELNHITIYRKLGSYGTIFEIPDTVNVEIVNVYRLPYGLSYDNKKIFGRIVINKPYTIEVNLNNGKKLKITIIPTQVEMYNF